MRIRVSFAVLAAMLIVSPLSAQIRPRTDQGRRTSDGSIVRSDGSVVRPDGSIVRTSDGSVSRASTRIPRGQLPPRGMCRVWIDGVAPGQQPYGVTDCATARAQAARSANARVIYGDDSSFPGRGKGKVKHRNASTTCVTRESVVVNGRLVEVCRDANGNIIYPGRNRQGNDRDDDHFDNDGNNNDDDDDQLEDRNDNRKHEVKSLKRANKEAAKAAKKQEKRNRGRDGGGRDN